MFSGFSDEAISDKKRVRTGEAKIVGHARSSVATAQKKAPAEMHPVPEGALLSSTSKAPKTNEDPDLIPKMSVQEEVTSSKSEDATTDCKAAGDVVEDVEAINKTKIEQLQDSQKKIEEENKKRKQILAEAIAERSKKTTQESEKLKKVQTELLRVDALITSDVSHLRQCIEDATLRFMEAEKRYGKAEKEFVASKLDLHECSEKKELLVEHLCQIIQQNEERKAKKLQELLKELELNDVGLLT